MTATLRRRESDGGYYTRIYIGAFVTYQISPRALPLLTRNHISVGDPIPRSLLDRLRQDGLATTGGAGIAEEDLRQEQAIAAAGPRLSLRLDERSWSLDVSLPEIYPELLAGASEDLSVRLGNCGVRVDDSRVVALRLWPGTGGAFLPVLPREQRYLVVTFGEWPAGWNLSRWSGETAGLAAEGDLFDEDGDRLMLGAPVALGREHFLVAKSGSAHLRGFPRSLTAVDPLGESGGWSAYRLRLPDRWDIPLQHWLTKLGHAVTEEEYRLTLYSPPAIGFAATSTPVIEAGYTALVGIEFVGKAHPSAAVELMTELDEGVLRLQRIASSELSRGLLEVPIHRTGTYRIRTVHCPSNVLSFRATSKESSVTLRQPPALSVRFVGKKQTRAVEAFANSNPWELRVHPNDVPSVEIGNSPVAPVVLLRSRGVLRRFEFPNGLLSLHRALESVALSERSDAELHVDAGSFGRLDVVVLPATQTDSASADDKQLIAVLKWLDRVAATQKNPQPLAVTDDERAMLRDPRYGLAHLSVSQSAQPWIASRLRPVLAGLAVVARKAKD